LKTQCLQERLIELIKTPGVYIEEIGASPPAITSVKTAIPAFIGYTRKAKKIVPNDLVMSPVKLGSLREFKQFFGGPQIKQMIISVDDDGAGDFAVTNFTEPSLDYLLYHSVKLFFSNGGDQCCVICVGTYQTTPAIGLAGDGSNKPATGYGLTDGLDALAREDESTLIVIPDAVKLAPADYQSLMRATLLQCQTLGDRFAIIDVFDGAIHLDSNAQDRNRNYFGTDNLAYGAAYYPFLRTQMNFPINKRRSSVSVEYNGAAAAPLSTIRSSNRALYRFVRAALKKHFIVLPPSGAIAGIYATTDASHGVWKAPANVAVLKVQEPVVLLDNAEQESLHVDSTGGKSINAIRAFAGKGTLVWGARTLAGNDNEWRYVSVRRFFTMIEVSVKQGTIWAVFEPNNETLWVKLRAQIETYLTQIWRSGALAGARPEQAFYVSCGLGLSMTAQDIQQGRMMVEIGMAAVRPAEFIILKVSHQLQSPWGLTGYGSRKVELYKNLN
jgi:phage tail sheath protein FI